MTVVATNAALAQVTVSQQVYEKDILLQWVCQVASPLQLTVKIVDDKTPLQLAAQNVVLHQRNTILRALCGIALCNALDQKPLYLLAGGSASPIVIGKIVHWMSVADSLRSSPDDNAADDATFLVDLEQQLQDSAFLMASSQASLADMDLALVLATKEIDAVYTNVLRWRETVLNTMRLANTTVVIPAVPSVSPVTPPIFFNGTEDVSTVLQPKKKITATKKNDSSSSSQPQPTPDKQQQQQKPADKKQQTKKAKGSGGGEAGGGGSGGGAAAEAAPAEFSIAALDIRVGKIIKAWHHPEAEKLFCEEVDLGTETRQIASGLRAFYQTEDLQDRHVLVLCNLKKRNLVGFPSHGMVLCASNADHTAVEFVVPPPGSKPGERIMFEGHVGEPEPENKVAKKKIFESLAPDLKTDKDGQVVWKGALAKTEAGVVKALNGMPDAHVA